ncbi:Nucleotide exchange factor Fes1 [Dillenia turbinata]|uniref:Nucleotide exchange factor Fes1 n=1 Tax=Dillenia turbinata TaxID=194707 RepID=A0AAN8V849_9MAGN
MEPRIASIMLWTFLLVSMATSLVIASDSGDEGCVNKSAPGGLFWSSAKEEGDQELVDAASLNSHNNDEIDGGFSSLDGMLQWAIGHSDPAKLKETAQDLKQLSLDELKRRQIEIKEITDSLKMPSDAQLMKTAINDLNNSSTPLEDRLRALEELLILVEPLDNANDMNKLGGLTVVIHELDSPDPEIRKTSAWILGKASQNNPFVQEQVLELGALAKLMKMVKSTFPEEATKALYAVSALIRNSKAGQELFYAEDGDLMLLDLLSNSSIDIRLRRKSVFLVGDLANCQLEPTSKADSPLFGNHLILKSVVNQLDSSDLDLQEKALVAIKSLLQLRTVEARVKEFCGLERALERMKQKWQEGYTDQRDYVMEMESLRRDVELLFHGKLEEV